jgi:chromosome segregation ATPase
MAHREQLDDVLDARAEIRQLRKRVNETKAAWNEAKSELSAASTRLEDVLTEIEQKQGRLNLPFDEGTKPPAKPKRRKHDQGDQDEPRAKAV